MMGWVRGESFWFLCPYFADVFEGRETLEGFEPPPIIMGVDEVVQVGVELPMAFVQALLAIGYRPVALSGAVGEKVVDIAIQRTLAELGRRDADVLLVSNDGDFVEGVGDLLDGRDGVRQRPVAAAGGPTVCRAQG